MKRAILSAAVLLFCPVLAWAQTSIQQTGTRLDAATFVYTNGATNCVAAAASAATNTVTIPAPQQLNQYIYITGFYAHVSQNATGTGDTQAIYISASNLNAVSGLAPVWDLNTVVNTTGGGGIIYSETYPPGTLRATAPNTAVVFTPSAALGTNEFMCYRIAGYYAP